MKHVSKTGHLQTERLKASGHLHISKAGTIEPRIDRETLGRVVRDAWVEWAIEQPNPKSSWLVPWSELNEADKEADRRIGEVVARHVIGHYDEDDEPLIDPEPGTFFDGNDWSGFGDDDEEQEATL